MGLKNQVNQVDTEHLMAKMADLQSSTRKLRLGQPHLYHEGYPVQPLNFRALKWLIHLHEAIYIRGTPRPLPRHDNPETTPPPYYFSDLISNIFKSTKLVFWSKCNFTVM